jgi:acyl carrier protein
MNAAEILAITLSTLRGVAPEIVPDELRGNRPLRQQVDLDSMDWLNFLLGLNKKFGVEIPEADYAQLVTLDDVVNYVNHKLSERNPS